MGEEVLPMAITLLLHMEVLQVVTELRATEGSTAMDQGVPLADLMGVTGRSLMEGVTDTTLLQVTSLPVLTQRHTSGSRQSTQTAAASSTSKS